MSDGATLQPPVPPPRERRERERRETTGYEPFARARERGGHTLGTLLDLRGRSLYNLLTFDVFPGVDMLWCFFFFFTLVTGPRRSLSLNVVVRAGVGLSLPIDGRRSRCRWPGEPPSSSSSSSSSSLLSSLELSDTKVYEP